MADRIDFVNEYESGQRGAVGRALSLDSPAWNKLLCSVPSCLPEFRVKCSKRCSVPAEI